ncbi:hypothetical protein IKA15_04750 [bacterium]|nr:hypothetical protein [bacterium]
MLRVVVVGYDKMQTALISGLLSSSHEIVGVMRYEKNKISPFKLFFKDIFAPSKTLSYMRSYGLYDIKAKSVNSKEFINEIKKLKADVVLVGSWGEKIKKELLSVPKFGFINCHPSLLPQNRGANPYFWAIYQGKEKSGVTFHIMDENFDTGKILFQEEIEITSLMNAEDLKLKACALAKKSIAPLLNNLEEGLLIPVLQDESRASREFMNDDLIVVDFSRTAREIKNHIRALQPYQTPYCRLDKWYYKIKECRIYDGVKLYDKSRIIKCKDSELEVVLE